MFDVVEQLKKEWTDKYVVVSRPAPELARFANATGTVRTVNMNGRCLVEFDQYNNIGWYDIDPAFLKIVPKPLPKPAETAKPAAASAKPAAASAKPAAATAKPAAGARPSTADILAAARAKGGSAPAAPKPAAGGARPSTADILAMARAKKAAAEPAAPAEEEAAEETVAAEPAPKAAAPKKAAAGPVPTTTAEKIAWCRVNDAQS